MPYIEGPKWIGQLMMGYTTTFSNGEWNVKTFLNVSLQPSHKKIQESNSLEWGLWDGPVYVLELAQRRVKLGNNIGQIWRILQAVVQWSKAHFWLAHKLLPGQQEWMSGTMLYKLREIWPGTPLETAKILHHNIFWFFMKDEDFVSRTINEGSVDLDKFPASKACQLANILKFKGHCKAYQAGRRGPAGCPNQCNVPPVHRTPIRQK